jgi:drug/metabolite transporter (DMT)-like permease
MEQKNKYVIIIHLTVLLMGFVGLFSKLIPLPAIDIIAYRCLFAILPLLVIISFRKESFRLQCWQDVWITLVIGVLMAVHWVSFFHSMQVSTVGIGMVSLFTFPTLTVFLEPLFYRKKATLSDIISGIIVFIGIYIIVPEKSLGNHMLLGVLWGLFSALLLSFRNIMIRKYLHHYSGFSIMFYQVVIIAVLLIPFNPDLLATITFDSLWKLLVLAVIFTALTHSLFAQSLRVLHAKTVGLIASLQVFYGIVLAAVFLNETPTVRTILGGGLVVAVAVKESGFFRK